MLDEGVRRDLHDQLDRLLDDRSAIEIERTRTLGSLITGFHNFEVSDAAAARKLYLEAIDFAGRLTGEAVRSAAIVRTYEDDSEQRRLLQGWLTDLSPLLTVPPLSILGAAPRRELTLFDAIDALSALSAGEIQPIFAANTGKNRRANRWSIAKAKLDALAWKQRLIALGYKEKAANYEITLAFGEQWDTIRRWRPQCEEILGSAQVAFHLEYAGSSQDFYMKRGGGLFGFRRPDPLRSLQSAGQGYQYERKRSAELSKRKSRDPS